MNVALYIRVSTSSQVEEGQSLDAQLAQCTQSLLSKGHAPPFCLYVDAGISAGSVTKRPAMTQLLKDIDEGRIKHVVCTKLDRAFRNVRDSADSIERIRKAGASIAFLDLQVDTSSAAGEMILNLMGSFAQFERKQTGERILATNKYLTTKGRWVGSNPPYGYRYDTETKSLFVHEPEAEIVTLIYEWYGRKEWGSLAIAKALNMAGYRTRKGTLWDVTIILRILRNPLYKGLLLYGRGLRKNRQWYLKDDDPGWVHAQGTHETFIDPELWETARERLRRAEGGHHPPSRHYLYSGMVYCGHCHSRMMLEPSGGARRVYQCEQQSLTKRQKCPESICISYTLLDKTVNESVIANVARAVESLRILTKTHRKPPKPKRSSTQERDREYWEKRRQNLVIVKMDGLIGPEEYERKLREIQEGFRQLEESVAAPPPNVPSVEILEGFAEFMAGDEPAAEKKLVLKEMVERVMVEQTRVIVHYRDWGEIDGWRTQDECARRYYKRSRFLKAEDTT